MEWNIVLTICHVCWCKTRWTIISCSLCYAYTFTQIIRLWLYKYIGCLCHADDIILISHSLTVMQKMLDFCDVFAVDLDAKFNKTKSVAMRIDPRYDTVCADLILSCGSILCAVFKIS